MYKTGDWVIPVDGRRCAFEITSSMGTLGGDGGILFNGYPEIKLRLALSEEIARSKRYATLIPLRTGTSYYLYGISNRHKGSLEDGCSVYVEEEWADFYVVKPSAWGLCKIENNRIYKGSDQHYYCLNSHGDIVPEYIMITNGVDSGNFFKVIEVYWDSRQYQLGGRYTFALIRDCRPASKEEYLRSLEPPKPPKKMKWSKDVVGKMARVMRVGSAEEWHGVGRPSSEEERVGRDYAIEDWQSAIGSEIKECVKIRNWYYPVSLIELVVQKWATRWDNNIVGKELFLRREPSDEEWEHVGEERAPEKVGKNHRVNGWKINHKCGELIMIGSWWYPSVVFDSAQVIVPRKWNKDEIIGKKVKVLKAGTADDWSKVGRISDTESYVGKIYQVNDYSYYPTSVEMLHINGWWWPACCLEEVNETMSSGMSGTTREEESMVGGYVRILTDGWFKGNLYRKGQVWKITRVVDNIATVTREGVESKVVWRERGSLKQEAEYIGKYPAFEKVHWNGEEELKSGMTVTIKRKIRQGQEGSSVFWADGMDKFVGDEVVIGSIQTTAGGKAFCAGGWIWPIQCLKEGTICVIYDDNTITGDTTSWGAIGAKLKPQFNEAEFLAKSFNQQLSLTKPSKRGKSKLYL